MQQKKHKNRDGVVYSTNPDFTYNYNDETPEEEAVPVSKESLKVLLDTKSRAGKKVTVVTGFKGKTGDIEDLAKVLKTKCGVGGSVKDREIIIQGDFRQKIQALLVEMGYGAKMV